MWSVRCALPSRLDRLPRPRPVAREMEDRVVVVERVPVVAERQVRYRPGREETQDRLVPLRLHRRPHAIEKDEPGRGEHGACDGQELLLTERERVIPVELGVKPAAALERGVETEALEHAADLLVGDL